MKKHREQTYGHGRGGGGGEEGEGEMYVYGESNKETYNTIYKIDSQWEFAVCLRELKQGLCIKLKKWEGDGRQFGEGGAMGAPMADSCCCMTDGIPQNSVKQLSFN